MTDPKQLELCKTKLSKLYESKNRTRDPTVHCNSLIGEGITFSKMSSFLPTYAYDKNKNDVNLLSRVNKVISEEAEASLDNSIANRKIKEQEKAQAALVESQQQQRGIFDEQAKIAALGKYKSDSTGKWYSKCKPDDTDTSCIPKNLLGKEKDGRIKPCEYLAPRWNGVENFNMIYDGTGKEKNGITPIAAMLEEGCGKLRNGQTVQYATGGKKSRRKKRKVRKTKKYNIKK